MLKSWLICTLCIGSLAACEQQKQASAEVGAIPKQMLDKATNDIKAAEALAADNMKALESAADITAPAEAEK
jgi:hypothetical protein